MARLLKQQIPSENKNLSELFVFTAAILFLILVTAYIQSGYYRELGILPRVTASQVAPMLTPISIPSNVMPVGEVDLNLPEGHSCAKFSGFKQPDPTPPKAYRATDLSYLMDDDNTITFYWQCPNRTIMTSFYSFCCSCADRTSHGSHVLEPTYTLEVEPSQDYAWSISCYVDDMYYPEPLRVIRYEK